LGVYPWRPLVPAQSRAPHPVSPRFPERGRPASIPNGVDMRRRTINLDDSRWLRRLLPRRWQSAAQLKNLRPPSHPPWRPGASGNPRGHRLGLRYAALDRPVGQRPEHLTAAQVEQGVRAVLAEREARAERRALRQQVRQQLQTPGGILDLLEMLAGAAEGDRLARRDGPRASRRSSTMSAPRGPKTAMPRSPA
jgi:hypothetical protein